MISSKLTYFLLFAANTSAIAMADAASSACMRSGQRWADGRVLERISRSADYAEVTDGTVIVRVVSPMRMTSEASCASLSSDASALPLGPDTVTDMRWSSVVERVSEEAFGRSHRARSAHRTLETAEGTWIWMASMTPRQPDTVTSRNLANAGMRR